jgi:DNA repair exonuclease SbcCD ATPase subunit
MKLINLKLHNFKGIRDMEFAFDEQSCSIRGANGTGKSTIADAFSWILTDKPMSGIKGFNPQTLDDNGEAIHHLDHSVTAVISIGSDVVTLKKTLKEKWTKKRGSVTESFSGRVTNYEIDAVPKTKTEFDKYLKSILDADKFQELTNIRYFAQDMKWQDRRSCLMNLCGDVTADDVIKSNPDIADLSFVKCPPEDLKDIARSNMKKLNVKLLELPERIDEAERALPEVYGSNEDDEAALNDLEDKRNAISKKIAQIDSSSNAEIEKSKRIAEAELALETARSEYNKKRNAVLEEQSEKRRRLTDALNEAESNMKRVERALSDAKRTMEDSRTACKSYKKTYEGIEDDIEKEKKIVFTDDKCPYCGQTLPFDQLEQKKTEFNEKHAQKLADLDESLKRIDAKAQGAFEEFNQAKDEISRLESQIGSLKEVYEGKKAVLDSFNSDQTVIPRFEATPEFRVLDDAVYQARMMTVEDAESKEKTQLTVDLVELSGSILEKQKSIARRDSAKSQKKRIEELKNELEKAQNDYAIYEHDLWMCEEYVKTKVAMITNKINSIFKTVSFRLFETYVNGGIRECCDVMIPVAGALVPWDDANTASKVNAGIEIIGQLSKHYDQSLPVFVDNAEGVTHINAPDSMQLIKLIVDDSYKKLEMTKGD